MRKFVISLLFALGMLSLVSAQALDNPFLQISPLPSITASPSPVVDPYCIMTCTLGKGCIRICPTPTPSPTPSPTPQPHRLVYSTNICWLISIFPNLAFDLRSPFYGVNCIGTEFTPQCVSSITRAEVSHLPLCVSYTPTPKPVFTAIPSPEATPI
jgi:hypothetical protein